MAGLTCAAGYDLIRNIMLRSNKSFSGDPAKTAELRGLVIFCIYYLLHASWSSTTKTGSQRSREGLLRHRAHLKFQLTYSTVKMVSRFYTANDAQKTRYKVSAITSWKH
ncbi:hypothetical protein Hypma_004582 [Hypsizygus marmoreus]|uniref:Uncharacterized protein n=1 Tax=Hypsizygus marmoreus TaxID=39966 RepID=A0A369K8E0_HYPMA|nr:hypothetical protein Hypma_004582 [Hypsizygus marmoreus]